VVYCLDALSGAFVWNYTTGGDVFSSLAVADGKVYGGSFDKIFYCLNAATGAFTWSFVTGGSLSLFYSSPAVANGVVYVGASDRQLYAFSAGPPIPEGLAIEIMLLISTAAVIVGSRYFRKRTKFERW
jgi:outer membrane protein assembly factor BamB